MTVVLGWKDTALQEGQAEARSAWCCLLHQQAAGGPLAPHGNGRDD